MHAAIAKRGGEEIHFAIRGRFDLHAALRLEAELIGCEGPVLMDLSEVESVTGAGVAFMLRLIRRFPNAVQFVGADESLRNSIRSLPVEELLAADPLPTQIEEPLLVTAGSGWLEFVNSTRFFLTLGFEFLYWLFIAPFRGHRLRVGRAAAELNRVGVDAIPIVGLISMLMGVILALNAASQLAMYGAKEFTADLVGIALTRELAPVITAVLVAGRSGSAVAAEVATMVVTEEIDALRVMGINPKSYVLVPKLLALAIAMPVLVVLSMLVGIGGGFLVTVGMMNIPFDVYWNATLKALNQSDIFLGLIKALVFGVLIGLTAATLGMRVQGGAAGVGRVTTTAVVTSFFLIIIFNTVFTYLFVTLSL